MAPDISTLTVTSYLLTSEHTLPEPAKYTIKEEEVLFPMRLIGVRPSGGIQVMLFLNVVSGNARVVIVLDGASLGRESIDHGEW